MTSMVVATKPSFRRYNLLNLLLFGILLLSMQAPQLRAEQAVHAQPELLAQAHQSPTTSIRVIVQQVAKGSHMEQLVERLGGHITKDLHIIDAFAAEIPAAAVEQLAQANDVRWLSLDAPVLKSDCSACVDTTDLQNAYIPSINADKVWNNAPFMQGQGVGVAVLDSGISGNSDFQDSVTNANRIVAWTHTSATTSNNNDGYGHGTHVAGIIGGDGISGSGAYIGTAPRANLISVKVSDDHGWSTASDVVNGLQWVNDHRTTYNIKVVNLSLNSTIGQSYHIDPIDAAAEIVWFNGVVVVASAGNTGAGTVFAPANDPFVITVGAMDDKGTATITDDTLASFSAYGRTVEGFNKPDLVAPGKNIVSVLANKHSLLATLHPANIVRTQSSTYFRMSGTSMAAPMVSGVVALLLQANPKLTPDQVKYRLMVTARPLRITGTGAGYLDAYGAVHGTTTASANTGIAESEILTSGDTTIWNSANWGSANWGSADWGSANWGSANWGSDYWGQ